MSDTPRTDEFCKTAGGSYTYDLSGLARHLERELAAAIAQRDSAREWVRATLGSAHLKEMDYFIKGEG